MVTWLDFWNGDHSIYVSERHKQAHADGVLAGIQTWLPDNRPTVLDFGCGEARYAEELAAQCDRLILCDGAAQVRNTLSQRLAQMVNCEVIAPEAMDRIAPGCVDLIVASSVLQYLDIAELDRLLSCSQAMLAPSGRLILADVIPPDIGMLTDSVALLRFGWREGFFLSAVGGLARTALSDYRQYRSKIGLATHTATALARRLEGHGLVAQVAPRNFGHNQARYTLVATTRQVPAP